MIARAPIAIGIQKDLPLGSVDCSPSKRNLAGKRIAVAVARPWTEAGIGRLDFLVRDLSALQRPVGGRLIVRVTATPIGDIDPTGTAFEA